MVHQELLSFVECVKLSLKSKFSSGSFLGKPIFELRERIAIHMHPTAEEELDSHKKLLTPPDVRFLNIFWSSKTFLS